MWDRDAAWEGEEEGGSLKVRGDGEGVIFKISRIGCISIYFKILKFSSIQLPIRNLEFKI